MSYSTAVLNCYVNIGEQWGVVQEMIGENEASRLDNWKDIPIPRNQLYFAKMLFPTFLKK